jgi:hypothetical protein
MMYAASIMDRAPGYPSPPWLAPRILDRTRIGLLGEHGCARCARRERRERREQLGEQRKPATALHPERARSKESQARGAELALGGEQALGAEQARAGAIE